MCCRIAEKYGGWPHQVAAFPFRYFMRLRNDLLISAKRQADAVREATGSKEETVNIDKELGIKTRG